jgi:pimeloyl-ACP methyl ester carboxylesterase
VTTVVVLHDVGDPDGGARWREALEAAGWAGPVHAPDLPGHGRAPAPVGGSYELADAVLAVLPSVPAGDPDPPVVLGVGTNGWSASILALGGRASALVLVDGLGGPFRSGSDAMAAERQRIRAIADDPEAVGPPPATGLDPRLRHGVSPLGNPAMAERAAAATTVPVLLVESPASPVTGEERAGVAARYPAGATVAEVGSVAPDVVAPAVVAWVSAGRPA